MTLEEFLKAVALCLMAVYAFYLAIIFLGS